MSARAMGSGTISFGLVSIPVKLYSSSQPQAGIAFNLLHAACGSRLKQQYVCPKEEQIVERSGMVKGYEFAKGQYVTFTEEELKALEETASEHIEITEFLNAARVDPVYFDRAYYLGPDKGSERAYHLLAAAMKETGRVAIAKYAARGKQYLVMIRPGDGGLVMQQLRYADEVKPFSEVPVGDAPVKENELALAVQLVDQIATDAFQPEQYEDEVKKRQLALIDKKVAGEAVTVTPVEAPQAKIIDLMEALKASLASRQPAEDDTARKAPKRVAARRARGEAKAARS